MFVCVRESARDAIAVAYVAMRQYFIFSPSYSVILECVCVWKKNRVGAREKDTQVWWRTGRWDVSPLRLFAIPLCIVEMFLYVCVWERESDATVAAAAAIVAAYIAMGCVFAESICYPILHYWNVCVCVWQRERVCAHVCDVIPATYVATGCVFIVIFCHAVMYCWCVCVCVSDAIVVAYVAMVCVLSLVCVLCHRGLYTCMYICI